MNPTKMCMYCGIFHNGEHINDGPDCKKIQKEQEESDGREYEDHNWLK